MAADWSRHMSEDMKDRLFAAGLVFLGLTVGFICGVFSCVMHSLS